MAPARKSKARSSGALFWDLLTFDRLVTGPVVHLIYWAGLGVVALFAFSVVGAAVGLVLLWRAFCEFYVAVFRISEDLRALRQANDADHAVATSVRGPGA